MKNRQPSSRNLVSVLVFAGLLDLRSGAACDLRVTSGWIREAPPSATTLAGYATLENSGNETLTITSITTPVAELAQLHETTLKDGMMQMRMLSSLALPAGGSVTLAPGGKHLMLTGLKRLPKAGEQVAFSFTDATGCVTHADFSVRSMTSN
jgi:copper(I)-binding protein